MTYIPIIPTYITPVKKKKKKQVKISAVEGKAVGYCGAHAIETGGFIMTNDNSALVYKTRGVLKFEDWDVAKKTFHLYTWEDVGDVVNLKNHEQVRWCRGWLGNYLSIEYYIQFVKLELI